jgi:hypothetical protein
MEIIIFKKPEGGCGIIYPSLKTVFYKEVEEEGKIILIQYIPTIEEIAEKDVPKGCEYRIATIDKLPKDRYFRNAWTDDLNTNTVDVDMEKAREIHMDNIRKERNAKFMEMGFPVKLDEDLEKAIIPKETRNKLQTLRDIPQQIDLSIASTPAELKAIWPEELS